MRSIGGATALAVLSLITTVIAEATATTPQACPYIPEWQTCKEDTDVQCATIQVPKNWYDASQGDIVLRLIRDPVLGADGKVKEDAFSVFYNPGGPGSSGINSVLQSSGLKDGKTRSRIKRITGEQFHVVSFDNRGVGLNEGYKCPEPTGLARGRTGSYEDADLQKEIKYFKQQAADCDAYSQKNSNLGQRIGTPFVARDIRELSKVMNSDGLIRYYGASYGTVLGDTLAKLFPNEIAKMTMDGNINPNDYYQNQLQDEEVSDLDAGFEAIFERCADATQDRCAWKTPTGLDRTKDTLLQKFNDWVGADPSQADRGRVDSPLTSTGSTDATKNLEETNYRSYTVRSLVRDALRDPSEFPKLATILQYWYENPDEITGNIKIDTYQVPQPKNKRDTTDSGFLFTDSNYDPNTAATAAKSDSNALEGITCSENTYRNSNPKVSDYRNILNQYLTRSKYAGDAGNGIIFSCYPWITTSSEPALSRFADIRTKNPVLFVQTTFDPVTPKLSGQAARDAFVKDSASIVFSTGFGHCSSADPSTEMDAAILDYWSKGILPDDGTIFKPSNPNPFLDPPAKDTTVDDGPQPDGSGVNDTDPDKAQKRDLSYLFAGLPSQPVRRGYTFPRRQTSALVTQEPCDLNSTSSNSTSTQTTSTATTGIFTNTTTATGTGVSTTVTTGKITTGTGSGTTITIGTGSSTTITYVIGTSTTIVTGAGPTTFTFSGPVTFGPSSTISATGSESKSKTTGKPTTTTDTNTNAVHGSTWATWAGASSVKSWSSWDPAEPSSKPVSSWSQWDPAQPKTTTQATWQSWSGQSDSVPATKTICNANNEDCKTRVFALPKTTVYVDYVQDICETGLYTNTVTVTATCNKGCDSKPTGIPQGYTTVAVYCSACAPASTVTITVKTSPDGAKATQEAWSDVSPAAAQGGQPTGKASSVAAQYTQDPWQAVSSIAAQASQSSGNQASWTGVAATGTIWNAWSASPTAPNVAKYTGAAPKKMASGGMLAAFAAGLLLL